MVCAECGKYTEEVWIDNRAWGGGVQPFITASRCCRADVVEDRQWEEWRYRRYLEDGVDPFHGGIEDEDGEE